MQLTRWTNVSVVTPAGTLNTDLLVAGDVFAGTVPRDTPVGEDWLRMDGGGAILFPGMLDLLQHGFGPHLYHEVEPGAVAANSGRLLAHGVTGFRSISSTAGRGPRTCRATWRGGSTRSPTCTM